MKLDVIFRGQDLFGDGARGVLTDEHAASSYGLPVVVVGGRVYGPGDLGTLPGIDPTTMAVIPELMPREPGRESLYEGDEEMRARRTPESMDLIGRARAAGYPVA